MVKVHQRVFALIIALLFLVSSLAFSGVVIWQIVKDNKDSKAAPTSKQPGSTKKGENMLQGTKLSNFTPLTKVDSLQKIDQTAGTGDEAKSSDTVTAHYTGAVAATGVIFQSSLDAGQAASFSLSQVIKGWTDGVPGMKVGGKRRLLIPADQAYGATPPEGSGIPPNADLVFDIELVKIEQ